ncbi:MAG: 16S rRNA (cytosine(1402)-N(4))-methyltransferase RsmH [Gammaproteobacteria bacterium]|nr:MAG: 16S rRNA (cytosine(1402)-N(4))-methyltransferase RsmH [Gammaproteobacteria bacterium]
MKHKTVLLEEAIDALNLKKDGIYIDATFGRGGHSKLLLQRLGEKGSLLVMDKDPQAIKSAEELCSADSRCVCHYGSYVDMQEVVIQKGWQNKVDGILLDLGVSSPQLDEAQRGFSFMSNGPLDMRMNTGAGETAAEWLDGADQNEIADVLWKYGEERFSRRIAAAIVERRQEERIETTADLASIISGAMPRKDKHKHPATRSFQAIRIFINRELEELSAVLEQITQVLKPGGRAAIISFHSLEDRLVKRFFKKLSGVAGDLPPGIPYVSEQHKARIKLIGKAIKPGKKEIETNVRARSAVMRVVELLA